MESCKRNAVGKAIRTPVPPTVPVEPTHNSTSEEPYVRRTPAHRSAQRSRTPVSASGQCATQLELFPPEVAPRRPTPVERSRREFLERATAFVERLTRKQLARERLAVNLPEQLELFPTDPATQASVSCRQKTHLVAQAQTERRTIDAPGRLH